MVTSTRARSLRITVVAALAAIAVTACDDGQPGDGSTEGYEDAVADALREQGGLGPPEGAEAEQDQDRVEEFLADCLAEAGFTYHPLPAPVPLRDSLGLTDREYRLQYGRGVSTLIDYRQAQLAAAPDDDPGGLDEMSEEEHEAYMRARSDCDRQAILELGVLPGGVVNLPSGSPLNQALEEANAAAMADPRVTDEVEAWSECMREQGFDYARGEDLEWDLHQRVEPFRQAYLTAGRELVDQGAGWDELTVEDVLTADQLADLAEIQEFELAAGAAEVECLDRGIDVAAVAEEVQTEYIRDALADF